MITLQKILRNLTLSDFYTVSFQASLQMTQCVAFGVSVGDYTLTLIYLA